MESCNCSSNQFGSSPTVGKPEPQTRVNTDTDLKEVRDTEAGWNSDINPVHGR